MSQYLRRIAELLQDASVDEPLIGKYQVTKVDFSAGDGTCYVFGVCVGGEQEFEQVLSVLKLYGPSMRRCLSRVCSGRRVPEIMFCYDTKLEKEYRINHLLDMVKQADTADTE